ncbi:zinc ribbon domain-containing protein [Sphingoaurantiacus capsulatus]|uniref:Zinc ribbon domain-containing protein n=1 Tax=Sphingoaurantiacus capsulatus TaxID=1771310 RepID=A0ABV7XEL2_9SPHN
MTDEKTCPRCAEPVKAAAKICRFCNYDFETGTAALVLTAPAPAKKPDSSAGAIGCLGLLAIIFLISMCSGNDENKKNPAQEAAEAAEEKRKGFHCLSAWDGSHRAVVDSVKASLRDPDSFEHDETKITPVDEKGKHALSMKFRARNGFGGMNLGVAIASVDNATCGATVVAIDS